MKFVLAVISGSLISIAPAEAVDFGIDGHTGTMGTGIGATMQLSDHLNLRAGLNELDFSWDFENEEGLEFDGELDFSNQYLLLDYYPASFLGFHITGGLFLNDNKLTGSATVVDTNIDIGDSPAPIGAQLAGEVRFDGENGYLGVGWGNMVGKGFVHFGIDVGVVFQGSPQVDLTLNIPGYNVNSCAVGDTSCIGPDDVEAEEREIEDEASEFDSWPFLHLTLGFSF
jgi:hypothetical protein